MVVLCFCVKVLGKIQVLLKTQNQSQKKASAREKYPNFLADNVQTERGEIYQISYLL